MKGTVIYKYIGNGASLPGVPARDLTEKEALDFDVKRLLGSGLYKKETRHEQQVQVDDYFEEDSDD
jgi:hypothetical protein